MLIGGDNIVKREKISVQNPFTHEEIEKVSCADLQDVELAVKIAKEGAEEWGKVSVLERVEIFEKISQKIEERKEEIAALLSKEAGKVYAQAKAEVEHAVGLFKEYAYRLRDHYGSLLPSKEDVILVTHEPLGVVACILPFNFPIELYAQKVAPALVAGNAVIIKPATETPLTALFISRIIIECGVNAKAIQVITGHGAMIGKALAENNNIDAISMTGSTEVGITTYISAAKNLKKCFLELGGNDPLIIFEDVEIEKAVDEAVNGRIVHAGQACCSSKRFIVHEKIYDEFIQALSKSLKSMKMGDPLDSGVDIGPLINEKAAKRVEKAVNDTINEGAVCVCGGKRFHDNFFEPTVLREVTMDMEIAKNKEIFGPVFPIIRFTSEEEAIRIANNCTYGLSSGVMSGDIKRAIRVAKKLDAGNCTINGSGLYRTHDMPFGGHKKSGIGTEGLYSTLDEFLKTKTYVWKGVIN